MAALNHPHIATIYEISENEGAPLWCWNICPAEPCGFIIAESADAKGIYTWLADWMDVCGFEDVPVGEDADAAAIRQSVKR